MAIILVTASFVACNPVDKAPESTELETEVADTGVSDTKEDTSEENQVTEDADSKDQSEGTGQALSGGKAVIGITQEPDFLDPHLAVAAGTKEILFNLFEGLVKMTPEGEFEASLAKDWKVEDGGKAIRFTLREGVKFHNGSDLTAEDVKFSLERAAGLAGSEPLVPELSLLTGVEIAADGKQVLVKQAEPDANLLAYLTVPILPQDYDNQKSQPVGTGPFKFKSYTPQVSLDIERFDDYWQEGKPYLDEVSFKIYGDMDAAYLELMAGKIDIFPYLTAEKIKGLEDKYSVVAGGANMIQLLAFNNDRAPLDNPLVREAINLALGRSFIAQQIMGDYSQAIFSAMAPSMGSFYNDKLKGNLEAQVDLAKEKLAEAGFEDGLDLNVSVPGNYLIHVDTANLVAAQLEQAGINLTINTLDWGTWLEKVYAGRDYQMTIIALTFDYYTPSDVLNRYMSDAPDNFINYKDETYDKLASKAASEQDEKQRIAYYQEMQKILFDNNASAYLQEPFNITVVRKGLAGYTQYPAYIQDMSMVYFTDQVELDKSIK